MSSTYSWYNENMYRDWPLVHRARPVVENIPTTLLVDAGVTTAEQFVYLAAIQKTADEIIFTIRCENEDEEGVDLIFEAPVDCSLFHVIWAEAETASGYIVIGDITTVTEILPTNTTITYTKNYWRLEPGQLTQAPQPVSSITFFNQLPHIFLPRAGCAEAISIPDDVYEDEANEFSYVRVLEEATGIVQLAAGCNMNIIQTTASNKLTLEATTTASTGSGASAASLLVKNDSLYEVSGDTILFECENVIETINGISGDNVELVAGPGVSIYPDPDNDHTIIIAIKPDTSGAC